MTDLFEKITAMMYPPAGAGNYWEIFTGTIQRVQEYYVSHQDWDDWTPEMQELAKACWLILGIEFD
jgi:hypothetical protein